MINYTLIRSNRRTISIIIQQDGAVVVRAPKRCSISLIESFLIKKEKWITTKVNETLQRRQSTSKTSLEEKKEMLNDCKIFVEKYLPMLAKQIGVTFYKVKIGFQKRQWGSCNTQGNLSFNAAMMKLDEEERIYILVHELCHRKYMNHSALFWKEVEKYMPNHLMVRKSIRSKGKKILLETNDSV